MYKLFYNTYHLSIYKTMRLSVKEYVTSVKIIFVAKSNFISLLLTNRLRLHHDRQVHAGDVKTHD